MSDLSLTEQQRYEQQIRVKASLRELSKQFEHAVTAVVDAYNKAAVETDRLNVRGNPSIAHDLSVENDTFDVRVQTRLTADVLRIEEGNEMIWDQKVGWIGANLGFVGTTVDQVANSVVTGAREDLQKAKRRSSAI